MHEPSAAKSRRRILVVEDDELMRVFYERIFSRYENEFSCLLKSSAEEALDFFREHVADAAIIDWDLPGINGLQLLKALRANPGTRTLPVIIASGRTAPDYKALALKHGGNAYLAKPFDTNRLLALLRGFSR